MTHTHFFQYNIPADNHFSGATDGYIDVVARWYESYYSDGRPIVMATPLIRTMWDCTIVKNWLKAANDIEQIADKHFATIARATRIAEARATLVIEGEPTGNPVLDRFTKKEKDLLTQETLS